MNANVLSHVRAT